jgi:hypothetical protein
MLKTYTHVFTSSAICCYSYVGDTYGNACIVLFMYDTLCFYMSARSIQNAKVQSVHVETVFWCGLHLSSLVKWVMERYDSELVGSRHVSDLI